MQNIRNSILSFSTASYIKEEWSSRYGFIVTFIGSKMGICSFTDLFIPICSFGLPYIIIYILINTIIGTSLLLLEISIGQKYKHGIIMTFKKINNKLEVFGVVSIITSFLSLSYNFVVLSWVLNYIYHSVFFNNELPWSNNIKYFVKDLLKTSKNFKDFKFEINLLPYLIIVIILCHLLLLKGHKSVELFNKLFVPLYLIISISLLIYTLRLKNDFYFLNYLVNNLDFNILFDINVWIFCIYRSINSNNISLGTNITLSSYLSKYQNTVFDSILIIFIKFIFEIVSALTLSFSTEHLISSNLAIRTNVNIFPEFKFLFIQVPNVLSKSNLFTLLFFILIFIRGLSYSISILLCIHRTIDDFERKGIYIKSALIIFLFLFSLNFLTNYNIYLLGSLFFNLCINSYPIILLIEILGIGWLYEKETIINKIGIKSYCTLLFGYVFSIIFSTIIFIIFEIYWLHITVLISLSLLFFMISYKFANNPNDLNKLIYVLIGNIELYRYQRNIIYRSNKKIRIPIIWTIIIRFIVFYLILFMIILSSYSLFHKNIGYYIFPSAYISIFNYTIYLYPILCSFIYFIIYLFKKIIK